KLTGYAVGILPKLRIHGESVMEELRLKAKHPEYITEILKEERNSIWVGKVKELDLGEFTANIFPKLRLHEENVMEKLRLSVYTPECIAEILKAKDKSIWIGKIRKISLEGYTKEIENKLDFTLIAPDCQEENEDAA
ncbi:MAG: uncharacterized protein A8A55_3578, partial [Amphiamblys sp. WSBS2006]